MKKEPTEADLYPIRRGWIKALLLAVLVAIIVGIWSVAIKMVGHVTSIGIVAGVLLTAGAVGNFNFFVYGIAFGDGLFLWHYLQRNVIAYDMWVYLPEGCKARHWIRPRGESIADILFGQYNKGWLVSYPLGGWWRRKGRVVHVNEGTNFDYAGRVKLLRHPDLDPLKHGLIVAERIKSKGAPRMSWDIDVGSLFSLTPTIHEKSCGGINWKKIQEHLLSAPVRHPSDQRETAA